MDIINNLILHTGASLPYLVGILQIIIHLIFASAVARDTGNLAKLGRDTYLVPGMAWAFATLVGGVFVAGLYWLMHYSSLARSRSVE